MFLSANTLLRDRYLIVRQIGKGGMGAVYEAKDERLGHLVALKQMIVSDENLERAFKREGRILAQLDHPALPHVIDYFGANGSQFLVMQYIPGDDLERLRRKQGRPFPVERVMEWADQLLDALDYLHSHSPPIIHRDIKPANLKLSPRGQLILLDFGIAKGGNANQTIVGENEHSVYAYTPHYAPLEQIHGDGTDQRSDLYSLAATFYNLLTAKKLPTVMTRANAERKQTPDPLLPVNQLNPEVPAALAALLSQAMALNPDERPQSARAMRAALRRIMIAPRGRANPDMMLRLDDMPQDMSDSLETLGTWNEATPAIAGTTNDLEPANKRLLTSVVILSVLGVTMLGLILLVLVFNLFSSTSEPVAVIPTSTVPSSLTPQSGEITPPSSPDDSNGSNNDPLVAVTLETTDSEPPPATVAPPPTLIPLPDVDGSRISEKDGMRMLLVPEGEFLMGSLNEEAEAGESQKPQRSVFLDPFWIDQTEVTNAQFARFVQEMGYMTYAEQKGTAYVYEGEGKWNEVAGANWQYPRGPACEHDNFEALPVVQVSWDDAKAYCEWAGRRLPSEAEWEKAARGTDGRTYPWGNDAPTGNLLNVCDKNCPLEWADGNTDDSYEFTAPVGSYHAGASPYGALDMSGNVWEWVADWYGEDYYKTSPLSNPLGPESGNDRVLRGNSWSNGISSVRTALRHNDPPADPNDERGFRCASDN